MFVMHCFGLLLGTVPDFQTTRLFELLLPQERKARTMAALMAKIKKARKSKDQSARVVFATFARDVSLDSYSLRERRHDSLHRHLTMRSQIQMLQQSACIYTNIFWHVAYLSSDFILPAQLQSIVQNVTVCYRSHTRFAEILTFGGATFTR